MLRACITPPWFYTSDTSLAPKTLGYLRVAHAAEVVQFRHTTLNPTSVMKPNDAFIPSPCISLQHIVRCALK